MKVLKILRKMLKSEEPAMDKLNLSDDQRRWYELGFNNAKSRFEVLIDLLEEE